MDNQNTWLPTGSGKWKHGAFCKEFAVFTTGRTYHVEVRITYSPRTGGPKAAIYLKPDKQGEADQLVMNQLSHHTILNLEPKSITPTDAGQEFCQHLDLATLQATLLAIIPTNYLLIG